MPYLSHLKNKRIYGNCKVFSPNDILMFKCDEKKANWYLKRKLATVINQHPLSIKLNFEPNGLGNHNKKWGLSVMENKCVVCGEYEFLTKHHVVPHTYRKNFPIEVKSHKFHDVLPLCIGCHEKYESLADDLKYKLSIDYNAPLNPVKKENKSLKYRKIASALLREDINIPKERKDQLIKEIKSFFDIKRLSKSRLIKISKIKEKNTNKKHGQIVYESLNDLQEFVEMWRKHFIDNMKPSYLPNNWDINNDIYE